MSSTKSTTTPPPSGGVVPLTPAHAGDRSLAQLLAGSRIMRDSSMRDRR